MTKRATGDAGKSAGVWIDHRKAQVVYLDAGEGSTRVLLSNVEKHPGIHTVAVETTDRLTDRQVVAKVRSHFDAER